MLGHLGRDDGWNRRIFCRALVRIQRLIGGSQHAFRLVARRIFFPAYGILDGKFPRFPGQFEWAESVQNKLQLLVITFGENQDKFVAAPTHGQVSSANRAIQGSRKFL